MMGGSTTVKQELLNVRGLQTYLFTSRGVIRAVDDVSLKIREGERVGLVGESGCGKSMTARSILQLIPSPPAQVVGGQVFFNGVDLIPLSESEVRKIRGAEIAMVFQDPMSYLNPTMRVGDQIGEAIWLHRGKENIDEETDEALTLVGLVPGSGIKRRYPHELSGGMRQRVLLAIALSCRPKLLIADEPTTALDVTIQAQILRLLEDLTTRLDMALLLISHDLGIIAELCEKVYVMYAGQIVEEADVLTIFETPSHPYTKGLLSGVLSIDEFKPALETIGGIVPDLSALPEGCHFHPRCPQAMELCRHEPPSFHNSKDQVVRCWLYSREAGGQMDGWEEVYLNDW